MYKFICFLLVILFCPFKSLEQIFPKEGSVLNFRLIGFAFPALPSAADYTIEIASGDCHTTEAFSAAIVKTINTPKNKVIAEVPLFNSHYTWRVNFTDKNAKKTIGEMHYFSTGMIPEMDTTVARLRILKHAEQFKDAYVFLDGFKALYDMEGHPVWYLSNPESGNVVVRDIKMTPQGSITYVIDDKGAFEVSYTGEVLWKGPNNFTQNDDTTEHYHHEFTRLKNGHYMALAQNFQYWKNPGPGDTTLQIVPKDKVKPDELNTLYARNPMATLVEYDAKGKVVWNWKSSDYFNGSDLFYRKMKDGGKFLPGHENSFYFDEKTKTAWLSIRNLNRIVKISYPSGKILKIYGNSKSFPGTIIPAENVLFCGQHSCRISEKGYLYLYNNNTCHPGEAPTVIMMKESPNKKESLETIWEYKCPVDTILTNGFPSGGNVLELPGQSMLVSMAYPDSKIFIVNHEKKIIWNSVAEKLNPDSKKWEKVNLFRASMITGRKQMEQLIWKSEK